MKSTWKVAAWVLLALLLSWGIRELFPKTDETESRRLKDVLSVLEDTAAALDVRAAALRDSLDVTRAEFEADTARHVRAATVAGESAEDVARRLRADLEPEYQARLDSVTTFYEQAVQEEREARLSNADRLRGTEAALVAMTDAWRGQTARADTATALADENWKLYQAERRRSILGLFDFQCTLGPAGIAGTKGADVGVGLVCGIGR